MTDIADELPPIDGEDVVQTDVSEIDLSQAPETAIDGFELVRTLLERKVISLNQKLHESESDQAIRQEFDNAQEDKLLVELLLGFTGDWGRVDHVVVSKHRMEQLFKEFPYLAEHYAFTTREVYVSQRYLNESRVGNGRGLQYGEVMYSTAERQAFITSTEQDAIEKKLIPPALEIDPEVQRVRDKYGAGKIMYDDKTGVAYYPGHTLREVTLIESNHWNDPENDAKRKVFVPVQILDSVGLKTEVTYSALPSTSNESDDVDVAA